MQTILQQVNTVPEVIGSLVCSSDGTVLGQAFPPLFDSTIIARVADLVAASPLGLTAPNNDAGLLDLRFNEGRVVIRQVPNGALLVLCTKSVNLPLLTISINVAATKLNPASTGVSAASRPPLPPEQEPCRRLILKATLLDTDAANRGFNELGMVGVNHETARRLMQLNNGQAPRRLSLTAAGGKSASFPIMLINDESGRYHDKVILSPAIERTLGISQNVPLHAEPA